MAAALDVTEKAAHPKREIEKQKQTRERERERERESVDDENGRTPVVVALAVKRRHHSPARDTYKKTR